MRFSVWPDPSRPFEESRAIVTTCERLDWHAAYFADHFMPNAPDATPLRGDTLEALAVLAALAARTSRIRLGTLVAAATYRHPAVFAKAMAAIDRVSGGRAIAGLGAGWQENEHASYGIELGIDHRAHRPVRGVRDASSARCSPRRPRPSRAATSRCTTRRATRARCSPRCRSCSACAGGAARWRSRRAHAAIWNAWTTPEDLAECNAVLDGHCEAIGRDPATDRAVDPGARLPQHRRGVARRSTATARAARRSWARPQR